MNGWTQLPGRWVEEALCAQSDPDLFFPDNKRDQCSEAKKLCRSCPVQTQCLTFALDNREPEGIWGGYSPHERKRIRLRPSQPLADYTDAPAPPADEDWHGTPWGIKRHHRNRTPVCRDCRDARRSYARHRTQERKRVSAS